MWRARVVGHQEAGAERPDDLHLVAHLQVAHVVAGHAPHRVALVVFQTTRLMVSDRLLWPGRSPLRGLAIEYWRAWWGLACSHPVPGGMTAMRLPLQHRKRHRARSPAPHGGCRNLGAHIGHACRLPVPRWRSIGLLLRFRTIEVAVGMRGRPRRHGGPVLCAVERGRWCPALTGTGHAVGQTGGGRRIGCSPDEPPPSAASCVSSDSDSSGGNTSQPSCSSMRVGTQP